MTAKPGYQDITLPIEKRVDDLVWRMTLEEKVSRMVYDAPSIERLGVPKYNWWNECLHGVGRAGIATVFPQAIGLGATWNTDLMRQVATTISDEARAGDLWRVSLPHQPHGRGFREGTAGRRSALSQARRDTQALCRPQRASARATRWCSYM